MAHDAPADIRLSVDQVPELYDGVRPHYPSRLFDMLFDTVGPDPQMLEVGPGTGQATGDLLSRGAEVTAVELGSAMAAFLGAKFHGEPQLHIRNQSFESFDTGGQSFDAVVAATAYHWVRGEARVTQPHRLLRPEGVLAVIDLIHVAAPSDRGHFDRIQPIYERIGGGRHDWAPATHETAEPGIAAELRQSELLDLVDVYRVPRDQTYTSEQYRNLLLSYSGTRMMHGRQRDRFVEELVAVVDDDFGGMVTRPLLATLTVGRAILVTD